MTLPKVYIYPAGRFGEDWVMIALHEDGEWYLQHICSSPSYGLHDLHGVRRKEYTEKFGGYGNGEFYDLVVVNTADEIPLPTLVKAGIRNPDGSRATR